MNAQETSNIKWTENLIIVDADYVDKVTFDLIVNFERMIGRRIPPADMSQWAVCVALDGGLREGAHETQLVLIHDKKNLKMENFKPSEYDKELNAQAFKDKNLGEFIINSYPVEDVVGKDTFILDILKAVLEQKEVKRIMLIPDTESGETYNSLRTVLRNADDEEKHITVFAMQPMEGGNFRQEILGYSLMNALGIKSDEIK
jgi:hypothetical protein